MGRGVRQLLRHAGQAGDGCARRRPRRPVRHRLAGHPAIARESARRSGKRVRAAALDPGAGAAAADARAGRLRDHPPPHGEGRRRDEPLGGVRLRRGQPRSRSGFRRRERRSLPPSGSSASVRPGFPTSCAACRQNSRWSAPRARQFAPRAGRRGSPTLERAAAPRSAGVRSSWRAPARSIRAPRPACRSSCPRWSWP